MKEEISEEEYLNAKAIVEKYEEVQFQQGTLNAMYCAECLALEEHDCFCEELLSCEFCSMDNGDHIFGCPRNNDPYQELLERGYD